MRIVTLENIHAILGNPQRKVESVVKTKDKKDLRTFEKHLGNLIDIKG